MHIFGLILLITTNVKYASLIRKCCDADSGIRRSTSTYHCDKDLEKRLQILTKELNYLNKSGENQCFDIDQHVNEYRIVNKTIIEERKFDVNFYPKCCPLGYIYNSLTHSCVKIAGVADDSFITQNFVQVGLPHCRVIADYKLNSSDDYMFEVNTLHLAKYNKKFSYGNYCVDKDENSGLIARGCYQDLQVCDQQRCVHKCCPDGQSFINRSQCRNTYVNGLDLRFSGRINDSTDSIAIIHKYDCRIYLLKESRIQFYLDNDGVFWAFYNKTNSFRSYQVNEKSYCIEHVVKKSMNGFHFFMCFPDEPVQAKFLVTRWVKILSCIFLIATITVYLILPELRNLFGKILMCYCTAMLFLFLMLSYMQFETSAADSTCVTISFLTVFASLCSFAWLNVMCFDIWWTFGSPKTFLQQKSKEFRRFICYSVYGCTMPIVITLIILAGYKNERVPYAIRPFIGAYKCYFEQRKGNYAMILFYVAPLLIINITDLVLFAKTIAYCLRVKNEIKRMNDNRMSVKEKRKNFTTDKDKLALVLKLSITMGIFFTFEMVSFFIDFKLTPVTEYIEIVWDTFNGLQGVFIFMIFVCKRKVIGLCRTKILGTKNRKTSTSSMLTEQVSLAPRPKRSLAMS